MPTLLCHLLNTNEGHAARYWILEAISPISWRKSCVEDCSTLAWWAQTLPWSSVCCHGTAAGQLWQVTSHPEKVFVFLHYLMQSSLLALIHNFDQQTHLGEWGEAPISDSDQGFMFNFKIRRQEICDWLTVDLLSLKLSGRFYLSRKDQALYMFVGTDSTECSFL